MSASALEPPPSSAAGLAEAYRLGFEQGSDFTVGLEEELILVDPDSLAPVESAAWLLERVEDARFVAELRAVQVELSLAPRPTVGELRDDLAAARARLVALADGRVRALAAGSHPTSTLAAAVTDLPRYREIEREFGWATRRGAPSGLHVHVALGDADDALAVYNAARSFLPELAALAANSPFFEGSDSGLASSRLKLTEDLPRSGVPPGFRSWHDLASFAAWGVQGGLFADLSYLWWDLRLRPEYGTLEFRVADVQTDIDATAALSALCHSLVVWLRSRLRAGERLPRHRTHAINENRWRAIRDGLDAELVDADTGVVEPARERLARLVSDLEPTALLLGCGAELAGAWPLIAANGAVRQREIVAERTLPGLLTWLVETTEEPRLPTAGLAVPAADAAALLLPSGALRGVL